MRIATFATPLSVCKVGDLANVDLSRELTFVGVTDSEISVVCPTSCVPSQTLAREDGWRAMRVEGKLDFSLVGILANISGVLARSGVAIFAVSTYDTDYVLVKQDDLSTACDALDSAGYEVVRVTSEGVPNGNGMDERLPHGNPSS